jgi:hypothetical protein
MLKSNVSISAPLGLSTNLWQVRIWQPEGENSVYSSFPLDFQKISIVTYAQYYYHSTDACVQMTFTVGTVYWAPVLCLDLYIPWSPIFLWSWKTGSIIPFP